MSQIFSYDTLDYIRLLMPKKFQAAQMGWIDLSIVWFARRKLKDSHLIWQENGLNFLHGRNATIGLDSNFYVFTFEDYGKPRKHTVLLIFNL